MKVLLLILISSILLYANEFKALVISENGLKVRSIPSASGSEIATIPFLDEVTLLTAKADTIAIKTTDATSWDLPYSPKIGRKYGQWQKVKWLGKQGWVFNAWLLYREKPYVKNLHFLNDIPQEYLLINKETPDTIQHDCSSGQIEKITFHLHRYNSKYNKPVIIYHWERDIMEVYEIISVEASEEGHSIAVREFNDKEVHTIRIKKSGNYFEFHANSISELQYIKLLASIGSYKGVLDIECSEDSNGYD